MLDSARDSQHFIRIYIHDYETDPFVIQFYKDTNVRDKEMIIKESLENILLDHEKEKLRIWDITDSKPIDIANASLAHYNVFLVSHNCVPMTANGAEHLAFHSLPDRTTSNGNYKTVMANITEVMDNSSSQAAIGPKAEIAQREKISLLGSNGFTYKSRTKSRMGNSEISQYKKETEENGREDAVYYSINTPDILTGAKPLSNPTSPPAKPDKRVSSPIDIEITTSQQVFGSYEKANYEKSLKGHSAPEAVHNGFVNYGKIYTNKENDLAVVPVDGKDKTWSIKTNFPPYTYLATAGGKTPGYNPKLPPPCYLSYDVLSQLRPVDRVSIFKGLEITSGGELKCVDPEILAKQKGIISEVLSKLASSIAEGRGVVGVSLPVRIFEPRSMIERITDWWSFCPTFLLPAAYESNPIERMKNVIAFAVAGLYVSASQLKPFNPLLGETYQGFFPGHGIDIYCEHTSHHPPIANFLITHKDFRFYGRYEFYANLETNTLTLLQDGANTCEFKNGEKILFYWPFSRLTGLLFGERTCKWTGVMKFIDQKNKIKAIIKMDDGEKKGVFSKSRSDMFNGAIYEYSEPPVLAKDKDKKKKLSAKDQQKEDKEMKDCKKELAKISGSWIEKLEIDGRDIWNINRDYPCRAQPVKNPLPSDCRYREDLIWVKHGSLPNAEEWKLALEVRQRLEKKLRQDYEKEKKKKK